MRIALWFLGLFAVAAVTALFAGSNPGTVTLFWPPYRVDLSLNLFLLLLVVGFVIVHIALRALSAVVSIPKQAKRWRLQQRERAIQAAFIDSLSHLFSGRFIRARKAAELVVSLDLAQGEAEQPNTRRLRAVAHMLAGEGAHALQDRAVREAHFQQAIQLASGRDAQELREGFLLRAARWAFDDRDAAKSMDWLDQLPQGAARRTLALRLRFKAARLAGRSLQALEMARLLTKHRAFSEVAGKSIARGLAIEHLRGARDPLQVQRSWMQLDVAEQRMPDVAMQAAERLLEHGGDAALSRQWVLPVWAVLTDQPDVLTAAQRVRLVRILETGFEQSESGPDAQWLALIESAQMANPRDLALQYLAGMVCMRLRLWGKAQQLLKQSIAAQQDSGLRRDAWRALAQLADQRQDPAAATHAYREALGISSKN